MNKFVTSFNGLQTGKNNLFVREWYEVCISKTSFTDKTTKKWFPFSKGGAYRKWYGNYSEVVNWENDGYDIRRETKELGINSSIRGKKYWYKVGITWSDITSGEFSIRWRVAGSIPADVGMTAVSKDSSTLKYILCLMNSKVGAEYTKVLNPTLHFKVGEFNKVPVIYNLQVQKLVLSVCDRNILFSKNDWDSLETSWDFAKHPLLTKIADHTQKSPPHQRFYT